MTDEPAEEPTGDDATSGGPAADEVEGDGPSGEEGAGEDGAGETGREQSDGPFDLKGILRQFTAPMIESLDARLREQVEAHVEELLTTKVDAAVADRLSTVDRAIADLSRSLAKLEDRLDAHDRADEPKD